MGISNNKFAIAQVAPYAWEEPREINTFIERLSAGLCERGHRVVILAPSESRSLVKDSRQKLARAKDEPNLIFGDGEPSVLAVGSSLSFKRARRGGTLTLPIDVSRTLEQALTTVPLDFVHVHEPFAPSTASAALRLSRSLNIGTFHLPTERVLSTQIARRLVELLFGRLDARTTNHQVTKDLIASYFPGDYRFIKPGSDHLPGLNRRDRKSGMRILYCADEERRSLRFFIRSLRKMPRDLDWSAVIWSRHAKDSNLHMSRALRERVRLTGPDESDVKDELRAADIFCCCSTGIAPAPLMLQQALASNAYCVSSRLPVYEELLEDGECGLLFEPRDEMMLVAHLTRLIEDPLLRKRLGQSSQILGISSGWKETIENYEDLYASVAARRHPTGGKPQVKRRLADRNMIHCDLHMHTDHSHDCATPADVLLKTAKKRGLDVIAITDHNEISGALEAKESAADIKVIVGEEIKTASEGEVIGLFINEKIPRGLSLEETIAEIKRQNGLVYMPHPFDRLHAIPDYESLLKVIDEIDIIEVFNPRIAISTFNEEAERFAAKYRIVAAAGSDSHVTQGLGTVKIRMREFNGPEEFLESLREADIVRKHRNLLYVQTLKFLQTKGRPKSAKRAARAKAT